ncbi:uncharacterized protein G2W53_040203 [Senna tora]|uniref:Uncharacterized protein n=1 Tax=Senna tora TaxID=362788 RepID=A0A834W3D7_9FABA|nr:uncharacterized protein G2W53_040203 [Senna tora]
MKASQDLQMHQNRIKDLMGSLGSIWYKMISSGGGFIVIFSFEIWGVWDQRRRRREKGVVLCAFVIEEE